MINENGLYLVYRLSGEGPTVSIVLAHDEDFYVHVNGGWWQPLTVEDFTLPATHYTRRVLEPTAPRYRQYLEAAIEYNTTKGK